MVLLVKKQILKNISFSVFANLISFITSVFMIMIVPKFLTVEDYGQWQLFLFYMTYVGLLTFGWRDGIYLRYAGESAIDLDKKNFSGQIYLYTLFMIAISIIIYIIVSVANLDTIKKEVFYCIAIILPFYNLEGLYSSISQMTNNIKQYAILIATERGILVLLVLLFFISGYREYKAMFIASFSSFAIACFWGIFTYRGLLGDQLPSWEKSISETLDNIEVGIKLLLANIVGFLIIGVIRFGISSEWDIATFGKVSLILSLTNFLMVFIDSVSVVFFPLLKHIEMKKMAELYKKFRLLLSVIVLGVLILYYPVKAILSVWIPQYAESLSYMAILFPICVYESKSSLLVNTYLKALRKEGLILKINLITILVSCIVTGITIYYLHSLELAIISVIFLYLFKYEVAEYKLSTLLKVKVKKDAILENLVVLIFILSGTIFDNFLCMIFYSMVYIVYVLYYKKRILLLITEARVNK